MWNLIFLITFEKQGAICAIRNNLKLDQKVLKIINILNYKIITQIIAIRNQLSYFLTILNLQTLAFVFVFFFFYVLFTIYSTKIKLKLASTFSNLHRNREETAT